MNRFHKQSGFSLTEVLMAVGILALGLIFIAGVFPAGIHFSTIAGERTIGAIIADEAFAKIRLVAVSNGIKAGYFNNFDLASFQQTVNFKRDPNNDPNNIIDPNVFAYPSKGGYLLDKKFFWSALCRDAGGGYAQVTVFVNRKIGTSAVYWHRTDTELPPESNAIEPEPVCIKVQLGSMDDILVVLDQDTGDDADEASFVGEGSKIVDDETGQIYEIVEKDTEYPEIILLDRNWRGVNPPVKVWVVPPPVDGGRNPCIAVYQRVIKF